MAKREASNELRRLRTLKKTSLTRSSPVWLTKQVLQQCAS